MLLIATHDSRVLDAMPAANVLDLQPPAGESA